MKNHLIILFLAGQGIALADGCGASAESSAIEDVGGGLVADGVTAGAATVIVGANTLDDANTLAKCVDDNSQNNVVSKALNTAGHTVDHQAEVFWDVDLGL
ncbi:MAG: hypothetical protein P8L77_04800 [Gammaproteobacteria bacterium]|nr:hypothetical protein [Gammaproteobacteria bacterium]